MDEGKRFCFMIVGSQASAVGLGFNTKSSGRGRTSRE